MIMINRVRLGTEKVYVTLPTRVVLDRCVATTTAAAMASTLAGARVEQRLLPIRQVSNSNSTVTEEGVALLSR
jgi:hypothetical protein